MPATLTVSTNGITPLPSGIIATIKTYLIRNVPALDGTPDLPFRLDRLTGREEARYRMLFRTLGTRWLWWSRLMLDPTSLAGLLDDPAVEAYAITQNGQDIALLELDFREPVADLAFLGIVEGHTGAGLGGVLMSWVLARAGQRGTARITVNTCTFDHPAALGFYRKQGFEVEKQAIEMVPDPRLSGLLPREAAPHIPLATTSKGRGIPGLSTSV